MLVRIEAGKPVIQPCTQVPVAAVGFSELNRLDRACSFECFDGKPAVFGGLVEPQGGGPIRRLCHRGATPAICHTVAVIPLSFLRRAPVCLILPVRFNSLTRGQTLKVVLKPFRVSPLGRVVKRNGHTGSKIPPRIMVVVSNRFGVVTW